VGTEVTPAPAKSPVSGRPPRRVLLVIAVVLVVALVGIGAAVLHAASSGTGAASATCHDPSQDVTEKTDGSTLSGYTEVDINSVTLRRADGTLTVDWRVTDGQKAQEAGTLYTVILSTGGRSIWFLSATTSAQAAGHPFQGISPDIKGAINLNGSFTDAGAQVQIPLADLRGLPSSFDWRAEVYLADTATVLNFSDGTFVTAFDDCPGVDEQVAFPGAG
jgi:FlaG/FlaF family flagellin (archaellin)